MEIKAILKSKSNFWLLTWPIAGLLLVLARSSADLAEYVFARGTFKGYVWLMSHITDLIPVSLGEVLAAVLIVIGIPVILIIWIVRLVKSIKEFGAKGIFSWLLHTVRNLLIACGIVFLWYMIGCGTNYYRYEFTQFSGLEIRKSTKEELYELCVNLDERAKKARTATGVSEDEVFTTNKTDRELSEAARDAMNALGAQYEVLSGFTPVPKTVIGSVNMSRFNITGVYSPFTAEANYNVDIPEYIRGVTASHELTHLKGFMREDEANFVGYLACCASEDPEMNYSGLMLALTYVGNELYRADKELYAEAFAYYGQGMILDLRANSDYWKQYEDTVYSEAGEKMNDTYLKANNQTDGTKSYGRMVDLLLAEYRKNRGER